MSNKIDLEALSHEERAAIEARRKYQRKWRAEHKANVREHNKRYWLRKAWQSANEQNGKENSNVESNSADEND